MYDRRKLFRLGIAVTAIVATVTSAVYLVSLAHRLGWTGVSALGLPVSLDVLAALAVSVWLDKAAPRAKRIEARRIALAALAVSVLGNLAEHVYRAAETGAGFVETVLAVLVGIVAPLAAFGGFRLIEGGLGKPEPAPKTRPESPKTEPVSPPRNPKPKTAPRPRLVKTETDRRPKTEARAWIEEQKTRPTTVDVTSRFVIGRNPAQAIIREVWDAKEGVA